MLLLIRPFTSTVVHMNLLQLPAYSGTSENDHSNIENLSVGWLGHLWRRDAFNVPTVVSLIWEVE